MCRNALRVDPAKTGSLHLSADIIKESAFAAQNLKVTMPTSGDSASAARTCHQTGVTSDWIEFSSCDNSFYISLNYHRSSSGTSKPKSIWSLIPPDECHTFCEARLQRWMDRNGDYWAVAADGADDFGTRGERAAFFDAPGNAGDPWHGYPVGGKRGLPIQRRPPDDLLEHWYTSKRISYATYRRLLDGRL